MANKNIQIKEREGNSWNNLYPLTLSENVFDKDGKSVEEQIDGVNTQLEQIVHRNEKVNLTAYDFDIFPNTVVTKNQIDNFFTACDNLGIAAVFDSGVYTIEGDEFKIPAYGLKGSGRNQTVLDVIPTNTEGAYAFTHGIKDGWTYIKGNIENITLRLPDESTTNLLKVSTPSRNYVIENVIFKNTSGFLVSLEDTYYLNFKNCVFEGKYQPTLPTDNQTTYKGTALQTLGGDTEVNNITFSKCDFKYLSRIWYAQTSIFTGSNTIAFNGCTFETIGDTLFTVNGFKLYFNNCYYEKLDQNKNVLDREYSNDIILLKGGGGPTTFENCLINLSGVRQEAYVFSYLLGTIILNSGSLNRNTNILKPTDYSSQGVIIYNQNQGHNKHAVYERFHQKDTNLYPTLPGGVHPKFSPQINDLRYSENSLDILGYGSAVEYNLQPIQPIVSVDGKTTTSSTAFDIECTLYRFNRTTGVTSYKVLKIVFTVTPSKPEDITPVVEVIGGGGDETMFADNLTTLIKVKKKKEVGDVWNYQVAIEGEVLTKSQPMTLAHKVKTNAIWIDPNGESSEPTYGIYPRNHRWD